MHDGSPSIRNVTLPTEPIENLPRPAALRKGIREAFIHATSPSRDAAFARVAARIEHTKPASAEPEA